MPQEGDRSSGEHLLRPCRVGPGAGEAPCPGESDGKLLTPDSPASGLCQESREAFWSMRTHLHITACTNWSSRWLSRQGGWRLAGRLHSCRVMKCQGPPARPRAHRGHQRCRAPADSACTPASSRARWRCAQLQARRCSVFRNPALGTRERVPLKEKRNLLTHIVFL